MLIENQSRRASSKEIIEIFDSLENMKKEENLSFKVNEFQI